MNDLKQMSRRLGQQLVNREPVGEYKSYTCNWKIGSGWESQPADNEGRQRSEIFDPRTKRVRPSMLIKPKDIILIDDTRVNTRIYSEGES